MRKGRNIKTSRKGNNMKRHHDNHGMSASVPGNGKAVLSEHWEHHYSDDFRKDRDKLAGSEWQPKCAKYRTTTHVKVNECDH